MSHPVQRRRGNVERDGDVRCSRNDIICHSNYRLASPPHIWVGGWGWGMGGVMTYSETYMKEKEGYKMEGEAIHSKRKLCAFGLMATLDFIHHLTACSVPSLSDGCFLSVDWSLRTSVDETLACYMCYLSCSLASSEPCGSLQDPKTVGGPLTGNNEGRLSRDVHPVPL